MAFWHYKLKNQEVSEVTCPTVVGVSTPLHWSPRFRASSRVFGLFWISEVLHSYAVYTVVMPLASVSSAGGGDYCISEKYQEFSSGIKTHVVDTHSVASFSGWVNGYRALSPCGCGSFGRKSPKWSQRSKHSVDIQLHSSWQQPSAPLQVCDTFKCEEFQETTTVALITSDF